MVRASVPVRLVVRLAGIGLMEEEALFVGRCRVYQIQQASMNRRWRTMSPLLGESNKFPKNHVNPDDLAASRIHPGPELVSLNGGGLQLTDCSSLSISAMQMEAAFSFLFSQSFQGR